MGWYYRLSLKGKLLLGFFSVLALTIVIVAQAVISMNNGRDMADKLHSIMSQRYARVTNMSTLASSLEGDIITYINHYKKDKSLEGKLKTVMKELKASSDALQTARFPKEITAIKDSVNTIVSEVDTMIIPMVHGGNTLGAINYYLSDLMPHFNVVLDTAVKVRAIQVNEILVHSNGLRDNKPVITVLSLGALSVLISIFIALGTASYCKSAISYVVEHMKRISDKDMSQKLESMRYKDEFGDLIRSIETSRLAVSSVIVRIMETLGKINNDMGRARAATEQLASNAQESEGRAVAVAASADEMVATTHNIANNCAGAADLARQSSRVTTDAMSKVKGSISEIFDQAEQTKEDSKQIETMINRSRSISSIVSTIDEIAAQTNLLALNAAIEAARAGTAGRGFAVVADEVRALASRTGSSTAEITQMVARIEKDANIAGESMANSVSNMDALANNTSGLEHVLNDILVYVNDVNAQISQIATAAEQQTTSSTEISSSMQLLTASSKEVADIAGRTNEIIDSTTQEVDGLYRLMHEFKL